MQITWTADTSDYHVGAVAGNQWFTIQSAPWIPNNPFFLTSSLPVPVNLGTAPHPTVTAAKDKAQAILDAFSLLLAPEAE